MSKQEPQGANLKNQSGLIFIVSGPSGSGKTTLADKLVRDADLRHALRRSVSVTTRPRRPGERQGRDYLFLSHRQFLRAKQAKKILEWTKYLGYYYGTPKGYAQRVLRQKKNLVLSLDLRGAARLKRLYPQNTVTIFVRPPSLGTLRSRIEKRCPGTKEEEVRGRLRLAEREMAASRSCNYSLVNRDLGKAFARLKKIVLKKINQKSEEDGGYGLCTAGKPAG